MKRRVLLIAVGLSSCLLPRVDFNPSLGTGGTSAGGGAGAGPTGGGEPSGSAGTRTGQGGKSGSGNPSGGVTSMAGSAYGGAGAAGTSAGETSAGGTSAGKGGAGAGGHGGTGTAGAGASAGAGGAGATGGCGALAVSPSGPNCCVASAPTTDVSNTLAIDDLEDGNNSIIPIAQRQGYWYAYKDNSSTETPAGAAFLPTASGHPCSLVPVPPACAGVKAGAAYSAAVSGALAVSTVAAPTYAGIGFTFNNRLTIACPYGASVYHGVSFWAKGTVPIRAVITIPGTADSSGGGTCTKNCTDHYGIDVALTPTTWKQFTMTFADTTTFAQQGWGTPVVFDPKALIAVEFKVNGSFTATTTAPYSFAIDDIAFVP